MVRADLDEATVKLARSLSSLKMVSLEEFKRLLHDNHINTADTLLELDALTAQLDCFVHLFEDPDFTTAVTEVKAVLEEITTAAEDWEARREHLEKTLKVGSEVRTDDMSSILDSIIELRSQIRNIGRQLRKLRKKGQFYLVQNEEKKQIDEKFIRLADYGIMDPIYPALIQSKLVYLLYMTRKKPDESMGPCRVRQKQVTTILLRICDRMRMELHDILKEANERVGAYDYCLDAAQDLTHRIPIHLSILDDILAAKHHVVDDAIPDYHLEIMNAVSSASTEFRDISSGNRMYTSFLSDKNEERLEPLLETEDNEENDTTAIMRNKQYANFLQFNLGHLPFPPLKPWNGTKVRRSTVSATKLGQLNFGAKLKPETIINRV